MNRERTKELIPIMQAFADGKTIQVCLTSGWEDRLDPNFQSNLTWRIKPEPMEIAVWVNMDIPDPFVFCRKDLTSAGYTKKTFREVIE